MKELVMMREKEKIEWFATRKMRLEMEKNREAEVAERKRAI